MKNRSVVHNSFLINTPIHEKIIQSLLFLSALFSIVITVFFVVLLSKDALLFVQDKTTSLRGFFFTTSWQPSIQQYGVLPLLNATMMTSIIAIALATPVGLCVAIYLSEYASTKFRNIVKPIIEILAGIPSVVYGYFAVLTVTPVLQALLGPEVIEIYNNLSAGLVIGILILPIIITIGEDALHAVPKSLRMGALAMGATKLECTLSVVFPAALSGISAAIIIAFSRAVGETMIVALAAGAGSNFTFNPLKAAETLTGYIVRISGGDISYNTIDYTSIFILGLLLFFITLGLNMISQAITKRYQEKYD